MPYLNEGKHVSVFRVARELMQDHVRITRGTFGSKMMRLWALTLLLSATFSMAFETLVGQQPSHAAAVNRCGSANPALGYGVAAYGGAWSGQHRDGRNADWADCEVGLQGYRFTNSTLADADHTTFSQPVIGPDNSAWLVVSLTGRPGGIRPDSTFVYRANTRTGKILTRLGPAHGLDRTVSWNAPLIDHSGNIYLGQESQRQPAEPCRFEGEASSAGSLCGQFLSFDPAGNLRWKVTTDGGTLGAQFTSDGNVIFQTWRGTIYVVDPQPGIFDHQRILHAINSFPEAAATLPDYPGNETVGNCLYRGFGDTCISANILAIHPHSDAIYNTVQGWVRGSPDSFLQRWLYNPLLKTVLIDPNWNSAASLIGGCASSPSIGFDGQVLFVNDFAGNIYAMDTETGNVVASGVIGYVPVGSNSIAAEIDERGNVIGHFISFQRAMELSVQPLPYMRVMRYRPGTGFQVIRVFDGQNGAPAWIMRRNPIGGLVNKDTMSAKILFVAIANSPGGLPYLVVIDPVQGRAISATKMKDAVSGTFSLGSDRSVIVSAKPDADGIGSVRLLFHRYDALRSP